MAWVRNNSHLPDDEVRELIEFATKGVNMGHVCVNVKPARGKRWGGRAYLEVPSISDAPPTAKYLITLKIGPGVKYPTPALNYNHKAPHEVGPRNRFPFVVHDSWQELFVHLAAHEARHVHQFRHGKRHSEIDTERFAVKALERYREENGQPGKADDVTVNGTPKRKLTAAQRKRHNERRRVTPQPMVCEVCGKSFTPRRSDARTCSDRCRQRLHRAKLHA